MEIQSSPVAWTVLTSGRDSGDHGGDRERPDYVRRGVRGTDRLVRVRVVPGEVDPANT